MYYNILATNSFFQLNKWKKFGQLYANDEYIYEIYQNWMKIAKDQGFECLNDESQHAFDFNLLSTEQVRSQAEEIIKSQSRIVVMNGAWSQFAIFFEMMYDLGVRRGQYQFVTLGTMEKNLVVGDLTEEIYHKRREVAGGLIFIRYSAYQGEIGEQLMKAIQPTTTPFQCSYYDTTLLIALVAQNMMTLGKEFENAKLFKQFTLQTRFTGCQGILMFEGPDSNNRRPNSYDIVNLQQQENNEWQMVQVGLWQPFSSTRWIFDEQIQWTDRTVTELLDHFETPDYSCGFDKNDLEPILEGQLIFIGACFLVLICTGVSIYVSR